MALIDVYLILLYFTLQKVQVQLIPQQKAS